MEKVMIKITKVYGKETIYAANSTAQIFADIARQYTLTRDTLKNIKLLGYEIEVVQQVLELA